ncbi:MAG: amidohydrolase family protein [Candidatus Hodarchaeales archaeon]
MKNWKLARTRFLLPLSNSLGLEKRIQDGYVLINGTKIAETGEYSPEVGKRIINDFSKDLKIIGCNSEDDFTINDIQMINGIGMPGFVKSHGHDHESPLIGLAKDVPLTTWLDKAVNLFTGFLNEKFDELSIELGQSPHLVTYLKARLDDISYGITTALTHHCNFNKYHVDELVEANKLAGTRLIIAVGSQDRNYDERILDTSGVAVNRLNEYYKKHKGDSRVQIIPGPDQFFSNGPELLKALKQWARDHNTLIHIHSSEEPATTKWFVETYGMTPTEYGESIGFLDEKTLLAHQVNNTEHDLEILARTGTMVVHNPLANTILGSGMPPIIEMMEEGIPVVISTDGSGSADNQNMLNAARLASQYQKAYRKDPRVMKAQQVLEMVTIIPARILGLNAGSLEPGKDADLIVLDLEVPNLTPTRLETVVENIIWAANGNEVKHVVANGQILVENYEFIKLDKNGILTDIQKLADLFEVYKQSAAVIAGTGVHL